MYGTNLLADAYLARRAGWQHLDDTQKDQARAEACLWLDCKEWSGCPTDVTQPYAFPRHNLYTRNGALVDSAVVPDQILNASYELAYLCATGIDLFQDTVKVDYSSSSGVQGPLTKSTVTAGKGGGVEVTKEWGESNSPSAATTTKVIYSFPKIEAMIKQFLLGGGTNRLQRS